MGEQLRHLLFEAHDKTGSYCQLTTAAPVDFRNDWRFLRLPAAAATLNQENSKEHYAQGTNYEKTTFMTFSLSPRTTARTQTPAS